jgi:hypothetical protein
MHCCVPTATKETDKRQQCKGLGVLTPDCKRWGGTPRRHTLGSPVVHLCFRRADDHVFEPGRVVVELAAQDGRAVIVERVCVVALVEEILAAEAAVV